MSITNDVILGERVKIFHSDLVNLYGCSIGHDTKIGAFVEIQKGVMIGSRCKISSHSFLCEGVIIEDNVFIGHGVMFTNDLYPQATNPDGSLQKEGDWTIIPTLIKTGASIGSNSTILAGVTIGQNAIVGAGSVITEDVTSNTVVVGNPARFLKVIEE